MREQVLLLVLALLVFGAQRTAAGAENGRSYLDMSGGYTTGDFGTPTRSELFSLSPTLGYVAARYDLSVTVPYLTLTNRTAGGTSTESGMGDVILRGGRVLMQEGDGGFSVDGALAAKLPTADEAKGLGTGQPDYGLFLSCHQRFSGTKLSLLTGYIKVGDPPGMNYNDVYLYGAGAAHLFGRTELYASYEGRRAMIPGAPNPQEIHLGFFHVLNADYAIKANGFTGLNKGGPDSGLTAGIVRWF